ncbi:LacI family DNA-binding transcriptional regulator [Kribbella sandramycini]|uniref:DNA-binding LacI/PurR family transcriptional regulator n=1 Tax=Kribbella sandramycini TaxID=60450 RepID=A0A7Y4NYF2_9ACTN|nr:LacI family DNA-binding transcriptional regulator [Kribbella sandramycini]MBB6569709.1 DNA-binding LacI/PurR family transcriptional regulator [Kribbella sandramycini]NOL40461.1 LacI family DNA-binding transcriptional regulator [Kribbella sandramycini]
MSQRPTLKSVAAAAGVSTAAVSYAFNRPGRLSDSLREHILSVATELGYAGPDAAGRTLRTRRAGAIGVIFTVGLRYAFSDPYALAMLGGVTEVAEPARTSLVLIPFDLGDGLGDDGLREGLAAVHQAVIDGAIADGLADDHPAVLALAARNIPLVRSQPSAAGLSVSIDDHAAGVAVGGHLAELGHREVVVVVATPQPAGVLVTDVDESALYAYSKQRLDGIRAGLGPGAQVRVVSGGRNAHESGRMAVAPALDGGRRPTAIAADSDVLAGGVLEALRVRGIAPGRELSVTGFDDAEFAASAGLTTVRQPVRERGRAMARMLIDPGCTERQVLLPTELVARSSTGPANH